MDACTRGHVNRPIFFFFLLLLSLLLLDKSCIHSKIVLVLLSASVKRFDVSRMRDFFLPFYQKFLTFFSTKKHKIDTSPIF